MESYEETIDRVLTAYGIKSTNEAKQIIKQANAIASGNLVNDLKIKLIDSKDGVQMQVVAPPYAKYIDYGVKGKSSVKKHLTHLLNMGIRCLHQHLLIDG